MKQKNLITPTHRIELVDALRGFSVLAILLLHHLEHFIFSVYPDSTLQPQWLQALDSGVFTVTFALFAGKAYALFALLFGFTFHLQYSRRVQSGGDFGGRFLWRLLLLAGFATLNAAFFPGGDVLMLFALTGVILFVVRRWSNRAVFILALVLLAQPLEWLQYFTGYSSDLGVGPLYDEIANYTKAGNFWRFVAGNVTIGQEASLLWAVGAGRVVQTAGLFLLGLLLGRQGRFGESETNGRFWVGVLIGGAVLFCPLYQLAQLDDLPRMVAVVLDMWQKLAFMAVLAASFVLLYRTSGFRRLAAPLRPYGMMSLTNYVGQSVGGALLYFPFGLYLAPYCGYTLSLLLGFAFFFLQLYACRWWLARHKQGPLEGLWHRLTWLGSRNNSAIR